MKKLFRMERFSNPEYKMEAKEEMKRIEREAQREADKVLFGSLI